MDVIADSDSYEPAHHSSGDGGNLYFGWEDARSDSARTLAEKIKDRFPRLLEKSAGSNYRYSGWFTEMLGVAERGSLPVMWREHYSPEPGQIVSTDNTAQIAIPPIPHSWEFQGKRYSYKPGPHLKPGNDWNLEDRPVGLSHTKFDHAREKGNTYWLYVVEHATDPAKARILKIQNPAGLARTFTFDYGWSQIAVTDTPFSTDKQEICNSYSHYQTLARTLIRSVSV